MRNFAHYLKFNDLALKAKEIAKDLAYKAGTEFEIEPRSDLGSLIFNTTFVRENTEKPGEMIHIGGTIPVPYFLLFRHENDLEQYVQGIFFNQVIEGEKHEAGECFTYKKKRVFDPHEKQEKVQSLFKHLIKGLGL